MKTKVLLLASLVLGALAPATWGASPLANYASVSDFLKTYADVETKEEEGVWGDLDGVGGLDWAGLVYFKDEEMRMRQIVVLTRGEGDGFVVSGRSEAMSADGGTGQHYVEGISIDRRSVFVDSGWHWHGCGGSATHQFRQQEGQWRLIGAEFQRHTARTDKDGGIDVGDEANISVNVLTGRVEVNFTPYHRKMQTLKYKFKPEVLLLNDYHDSQGEPDQLPRYADC